MQAFDYTVKEGKYVAIRHNTSVDYIAYSELDEIYKAHVRDNIGTITFDVHFKGSLGMQSFTIPYNNAIESNEIMKKIDTLTDLFFSS